MTTANTDAHILKPSDITAAIDSLVGLRRPTFLWGSPGIGKSDIVRQVADQRGIQFIDMRATQKDPIDLRGIPAEHDGMTRWLPPSDLPRDGEGILFLDELNTAPPLTQAAFYQLILDRAIGEYTLPEGWSVVAAGNRETDRAVTHRMSTALSNRFTHLELAVDLDDWIRWGVTNGVRDEVIAFARYRPDLLHSFDPAANEKRFPTPRTWAGVSDIIGAHLPPHVEYATIAGTVGDGAAAEFTAFLQIFRKLPDPASVLADPKRAAVPDQPAILYALSSLIARHATRKNMAAVWQYAQRMPAEFAVVTIVQAAQRDAGLCETKAFIEFSSTHSDLVI